MGRERTTPRDHLARHCAAAIGSISLFRRDESGIGFAEKRSSHRPFSSINQKPDPEPKRLRLAGVGLVIAAVPFILFYVFLLMFQRKLVP
jgi:hypothetical protein